MPDIARSLALAGMSALALGVLAVPAGAHVTVSPNTATKGGYATLNFKVPNERPDAGTTVLEVDFPEAHPFASISVQPKPGWTYRVERAGLATPIGNHGQQVNERISRIVWTADPDSAIKPGEFDVFPVSAGPLPADASSLTFKALQTYSSGEIVRWIEEAAPGAEEPRFPAPTLTLTDPAAAPTAAPGTPVASSEDLVAATKNDVDTAMALAIVGIVLAFVAGGIGGAALARRPKETAAPSAD